MRTHVTFRRPAEFVSSSEEDGILGTIAAGWFVELLRRVDGLAVDSELIQEDWGVVAMAARNNCRFWVGLSLWPEGESAWLAHVHHASSAWLQRFTSKGKSELRGLTLELHAALKSDPKVQEVAWYLESELASPNARGTSTP